MGKGNLHPIEELIQNFIQYYGVEEKLAAQKVIRNWEHLVGPEIANHTAFVKYQFRNKRLIIKLRDGLLAHRLQHETNRLMTLFKAYTKNDKWIEEIKIY
jgi:predicted nucleic acid-binding Zn ribbon protein